MRISLKKTIPVTLIVAASLVAACGPEGSVETDEMLGTHLIRVDADGKIVPWNYDDPAIAYDDIMDRLWEFWKNVPTGSDGTPLYMTAQIANRLENDGRGIAGDEFSMLIDSWMYLYRYLADKEIYFNMRYMADTYIKFGLSPADCKWPNLPFPYNTCAFTTVYDGDMILGPGFLQPDKAGTFGWALLDMYRVCDRDMPRNVYLDYAVKIADSLAERCRKGDYDHSPWPFKVNAYTGEVGALHKSKNTGKIEITGYSEYTTNYSHMLELFMSLCDMGVGNTDLYRRVIDDVLAWMKEYPMKNHRWGPYHEDVPCWSDTHENAVAWAQFIMGHQDLFDDWKSDVNEIFDWIYDTLGNYDWEQYGVVPVNEQTTYHLPGNSHTSQQACAELEYVHFSGDSTRYESAVRKLNWATYMVDENGDNVYIYNDKYKDHDWFSDGYGEYVRHYMRAMAICPELTNPNENHIINSTNTVNFVNYRPSGPIMYKVRCVGDSEVTFRLAQKPSDVEIRDKGENDRWTWEEMPNGGGLLKVYYSAGGTIFVMR